MKPLLFVLLLAVACSTPPKMVMVEKPETAIYNPVEHKEVCPKCGKCHPIEGVGLVTAMYCGERGCCNTTTYTFTCRTTGEQFTISINECDYITWWTEQ